MLSSYFYLLKRYTCSSIAAGQRTYKEDFCKYTFFKIKNQMLFSARIQWE